MSLSNNFQIRWSIKFTFCMISWMARNWTTTVGQEILIRYMFIRGHYITNPNNALLFTGNASMLPYICIKFHAPNIGNLMSPVHGGSSRSLCFEKMVFSSHHRETSHEIQVTSHESVSHEITQVDMYLFLKPRCCMNIFKIWMLNQK